MVRMTFSHHLLSLSTSDEDSAGKVLEKGQSTKKTTLKPFLIKKKKKKDNSSNILEAILKMEENHISRLREMEANMKAQETAEEQKFQERMRNMEMEHERKKWEREEEKRVREEQRRREDRQFQMQMAQMFSGFAASVQSRVPAPTPFCDMLQNSVHVPASSDNSDQHHGTSSNTSVTFPTYEQL